MFWVKRLAFLLLVAGVAYSWYAWSQIKANELEQLTKQNALLTARVWIGTARYYRDSTKFISFRDSLLKEAATTVEDLNKFLKLYEDEPENLYQFSSLVSQYVDSLSKIEDSLRRERANEEPVGDSTASDSVFIPRH